MEHKSHHPQKLGQPTSTSNKRGPPEDLDDVCNPDDQMELDSDTPGSRKRNDHRHTPIKHQVQMFPLFRQDASTKSSVSRTLFPGEQPQKAQPASVPLPDSPRQEEGAPTSLTVVEDVKKCNSSNIESEQQAQGLNHAG